MSFCLEVLTYIQTNKHNQEAGERWERVGVQSVRKGREEDVREREREGEVEKEIG